jgi:hypothetical protein
MFATSRARDAARSAHRLPASTGFLLPDLGDPGVQLAARDRALDVCSSTSSSSGPVKMLRITPSRSMKKVVGRPRAVTIADFSVAVDQDGKSIRNRLRKA